MDFKGYHAYKEQSLSTMTKGEVLVLLYDELLKRLARGKFALENENLTMFDESITRSREIVEHLTKILDYNYPISNEIKKMYDFFLYEIARITASRNPDLIPDLQNLVRELRDTFEEASRKANF